MKDEEFKNLVLVDLKKHNLLGNSSVMKRGSMPLTTKNIDGLSTAMSDLSYNTSESLKSYSTCNDIPEVQSDLPLLGKIDMYRSHPSRHLSQKFDMTRGTSVPLYTRNGCYSNSYGNLTFEHITNPYMYLGDQSFAIEAALAIDAGRMYHELQDGSQVKIRKHSEPLRGSNKIKKSSVSSSSDTNSAQYPWKVAENGSPMSEALSVDGSLSATLPQNIESIPTSENILKISADTETVPIDEEATVSESSEFMDLGRSSTSSSIISLNSCYNQTPNTWLNEIEDEPALVLSTSAKYHQQVMDRRIRMEREWMKSEKRIELTYGKRAALAHRKKVRELQMASIREA